ncbi:dynamin family protein [Clostridium beijerinckii]|uniref:GTP-binding protein n=2 Tax=Clostridium TaxID=1485 RepID=A0A1S8SEQ4_CLOBE|nr:MULTISPECIES: dynamin family protein [Clostridium]MBN7576596.1 dynamin family protein [Clostridium beijerinckii]MBN7581615.1 dynamin family protein [Clostridium beijerinckii]MBN7586353.1 dynamin family protein [Clostridium beijerinckii]MBO0519404.1 dynamin family protein [Clostridium beijerinckii]MZK50382.1 GTP-binding protein [Clostridium beijerinckii]
MNIFKNCVDRQNRIDKVVNILDNDEITAKNLLIKDRIINPAHYIVMLGETSSGKSALINSIFQRKILVESVKPTTGIVTEVIIDESSEETLFAINNDLSIDVLDDDSFSNLTVKPDGNINRLRYIGPCKDSRYSGMRIFDTPGYGSLVERHEEVLKNFIPESDFIIYVVSYKTGIGEDDFQFLKYVGEIINDNVEVVLAVNMCPQNIDMDNKRINEIRNSVSECIHKDIETFLIESSIEKNPDTDKLWNYIYKKVNDPDKEGELSETLKNYQDYLLRECDIKISSRIAEIECKKEEVVEKANVIKEFLDKKDEILDVIENGFVKIKLKAVRLIGKSDMKIKENITNYIYDESKWSMKEETFTLMQHYYVPKLTSEETENLNTYIEDEVINLDREVENILNTEIIKLKENVKRSTPSYNKVVEDIIEKHRGDSIERATGEMFRTVYKGKFNNSEKDYAISKNLKKLSNTFEKSSVGEVNNNLNHLLKTIRATSLKGITESLNVFTDSIFFLYDSLTWQKKINEISVTAIDNWANNIEGSLRKYLDELKEISKEEVLVLFDELSEEFTNTKDELKNISSEELVRLKKEIEFLLYKCLLINITK